MLLATIGTELLVILKFSRGQFSEPFPPMVKQGWALGAFLLVLYPAVKARTFDFDTCHLSILISPSSASQVHGHTLLEGRSRLNE